MVRKLGAGWSGSQMFDQRQLGSGMQLPEVYLIHKGANEEDAAAGAAQQVLGSQRIGESGGVESFAFIRDADHKVRAGIFEGGGHAFVRAEHLSMQHRVD